ncbi:MAG: right-handed parallel beta-helix repeat-containing protein, partial [Thermoplasmata archaeon]
TNGKEMETMAGKGVLGIGESYAVYFYMIDWNGNKGMVDNAFRSENAKVSMSGLYLNSHAIARAKSMGMEVKGTSHAPIHINGNDDFANQAANEGWPGDGSEGNPYIIDGLEIDANGGTYGIWIENTDVYFVIRNCTVYSATSSGGVPYGTGIALNNVTHATLESNKCNNSTYGIFLYGGSQYNTITNNNASGNSDCGICLFESSNNNITNNNASGNSYFGILLSSSSNNNITNNNASGNSHNGIYLWYSSNNNITTNILWENGIVIWGDRLEHWNTHTIDTSNLVNGKPVYYYKNQDGGTVPADAGQVILANCSNMVVSGLSISNASIGIQLGFSNYNTITNNNASGNSRYGIYLWHSSNNTVTNNTASGNSECGIHLDYSSNNNITNNNASGNSYFGIYLWHSNNNITNNNASGNYYCGISLHYYSSNNTITNNNASNNSYYGIYLCDSSNNNITNNNASGNSWIGIYLDSSSNNIITYNWICNTVYYGVYITGGSTGNTIHHNNFIGNNGAGKGVNGSCQAYDSVGGNYWYDNSVNEGNYWSNWDHSGAYPIDGGAGASDPYPLVNPVAEFSSMPLFMLALASLLILARVRKPHKHS